ncbi:MAG: Fe-S protein assembly co-chaperone HscB [Polaromonas sp.]|nr:Fe-S protein assembly co-chaperone HscB [Polaromonas sp.]
MNLQSTDFELFGVPAQFVQDGAALDARWKELQREAHPDKFAAQGAAAQRVAMQWSVRINEAYRRLKNPLQRASYLCELNGVPIAADTNTAMPAEFLMQQMQWREDLEDATSVDALEAIALQTRDGSRDLVSALQKALDDEKDFASAARIIRSLMFIERFAAEVDARIEQMEE